MSCCCVFVFRIHTHQLCHSVDIHFPLLQASAEEHGCCHQEVVSYTVSVNIQRCNLAAIVGANLKEIHMHFIEQAYATLL